MILLTKVVLTYAIAINQDCIIVFCFFAENYLGNMVLVGMLSKGLMEAGFRVSIFSLTDEEGSLNNNTWKLMSGRATHIIVSNFNEKTIKMLNQVGSIVIKP